MWWISGKVNLLRVFSEKLNSSTVSVNIGPEALVACWMVACLISGDLWLDDLRDCLDLYKRSQGMWEIGIPMVSAMAAVSVRP